MKQVVSTALPATFEANIDANDADEVSEYLSQRVNPVQVRPVQGGRTVRLQGNFGFTGSVGFWSANFDFGAELTPLTDFDGYFFYSPMAGALTAKMRSDTLESAGGRAIMGDGAHFRSVCFAPGRRDVGVCFDRAAIVQRLSQLLDAPLRTKLVFEPYVNVRDGPGAAMVGLTTCLNGNVFGPILNAAPLTSARISATMIDMVLETLPHNFSEHLVEAPRLIAPRHVRRAIEYIKAHLAETVTVDEISQVCGVSVRALQYGFQRFVGVTPGEYLRSSRLEAARRDIETNAKENIGDVARRWGFTNAGRFNTQFKMQFGESASSLRTRVRGN